MKFFFILLHKLKLIYQNKIIERIRKIKNVKINNHNYIINTRRHVFRKQQIDK